MRAAVLLQEYPVREDKPRRKGAVICRPAVLATVSAPDRFRSLRVRWIRRAAGYSQPPGSVRLDPLARKRRRRRRRGNLRPRCAPTGLHQDEMNREIPRISVPQALTLHLSSPHRSEPPGRRLRRIIRTRSATPAGLPTRLPRACCQTVPPGEGESAARKEVKQTRSIRWSSNG